MQSNLPARASCVRLPLCAAIALTLCPVLAQAAALEPATGQVLDLGGVKVRAEQADPKRQPDAVAPSASVTAADMAHINLSTTEEAFKHVPNLHVRQRFVGDDNSVVSVRSASTRQSARILVYADGLLLSNFLGSDFTFAPRWSMVAPDSLESVQVFYGPYSARYPGNALGATIEMTTHMPERLEGGGAVQMSRQDFEAYGHSTTADIQHDSAWLGDRRGSWSWRLALDRLDGRAQPASYYTAVQSTTAATAADTVVTGASGYRDQFSRPGYILGVNSEGEADTRANQVAFKAAYDFGDGWQAWASVTDWRQDQDKATGSWLHDAQGNAVSSGEVAINGWHYTLPANAFAPTWTSSERRLYGAALKKTGPTGWNMSLVASRFETPRDIGRTSSSAGAGPGQVSDGQGTGWDTLDLQTTWLASEDAAHTLALGAHWDEYTLDSSTRATDDWRHGEGGALVSEFAGRTRTQALYVEDTWRLAPGWSLTPGLRYERWTAFDGRRRTATQSVGYDSRRLSRLSPKLSLARELDEVWTARLSLARAYRMPTVSELFQGSISGTAIVNNDPNLKPENDFSKDLSFERALAGGSLRLSFYEDDVRDTLFSQTDTTVFPTVTSVQNVDRVRTRGVELAAQARDVWVDGLDLSASLAYNHAETLENRRNPASVGKRFYRIPEWRADVVASYRFDPVFTGTLSGRYSGRQYNSLDNTDTNPGDFGGTSRYTVFDARLEAALNAQWKLAVGVDNLTDERYYVYHPYPGRTWSAEARYRF